MSEEAVFGGIVYLALMSGTTIFAFWVLYRLHKRSQGVLGQFDFTEIFKVVSK